MDFRPFALGVGDEHRLSSGCGRAGEECEVGAKNILTTEAVVAEVPEKEGAAAAAACRTCRMM